MVKIIPAPLKVTELDGTVELSGKIRVYIEENLRGSISFIKNLFVFIDENSFVTDAENADIIVKTDLTLKPEGYSLIIKDGKISVSACDERGIIYGFVTLKQLVNSSHINNNIKIGCAEIYDEPKYMYRGLQLDESRHFFGKDVVKEFLDLMALYKLNSFHWHLTDDQGWRIEIKKYPLLTEIGSKRKDSSIGGWKRAKLEGKPHEGFYTQEDIKEIVSYAKERNITIIPEIDMPAHFAAAMASYNYLGCREIPCEVHYFFGGTYPTTHGMKAWNRSACAGKESTYSFIFDVIDEICELFPSEYFHIGGDEAPKDEWKKCPECLKRMSENGLNNVEELQGYFNNRISDYLKKKGKKLVVWNEALSAGNLDESVIGQYWTTNSDKNVNRHLSKGGKIIVSKHESFYFDMPYALYPLRNTFDFDLSKIIDMKYADNVLGVEGELWTEWIATKEKLEFQAFPRVFALSETAWSVKKSSYSDFRKRVTEQEAVLADLGVNFADDKIADAKNGLKRQYERIMWSNINQDREFVLNQKLH